MIFSQNRYSNVVVYNSIINNLDDTKLDNNAAFTFIEYLNYTKSLDKNIVDFSDYQTYLENWNTVTSASYSSLASQVQEQFISFLESITLNYTTAEEKRFLSNIDFNNPEDVEIAAPFFSNKIKQIILYFAEKRDSYNIDLQLTKNKGSINGVVNYLRTSIIETLFGQDLSPIITLTQPLSVIGDTLQVEVEEGYDIFNDYFDLDPTQAPSFYDAIEDRAQFFTSNTNNLNQNVFINYDQAIIDLINSEQVVCDMLNSLVFKINQPDLDYLQTYDFIDYETRTRDNIKLVLEAQLIQQLLGTDFYYISTNSTGSILSGVLFEATSPFSNLLNINFPSNLTVPSTATRYERDVGLFFKPSKQSILRLQSPFTYYTKADIKNDYVYVFPDPNSYGNISGVSKVDHETPLGFNLDGNKIQKNISSNFAIGNSLVTNHDLTFESYHSKEQIGAKNVLKSLYNSGIVTSMASDIYGNLYIGLKQQNTNYINNFNAVVALNTNFLGLSSSNTVIYLSSIQGLFGGTFTNTSSVDGSIGGLTNQVPLYTTRTTPGKFIIYNIALDTLNPLSAELSNILYKYPAQQSEIQNKLISVETYESTYVLTTSSYIIVDQFAYDQTFQKTSTVPLILSGDSNNVYSNVFLKDSTLYVAKYSLVANDRTNYNNRQFSLSLYSYDISNNTYKTILFTLTGSNIFSYNVNSKLNAYNIKLAYNKKQDVFNVVLDMKDLNKNMFLHNIGLQFFNNTLNVVKNTVFNCTNSNLTINFYDGSSNSYLQFGSFTSSPTINSTNGTIIF